MEGGGPGIRAGRRVKILIDMNLSAKWISALRFAGLESVHWSDVGAVNAPDVVIADYAAANGFTVLTQDLDFGAILAASNSDRPSVVQLRTDDLSPNAVGAQVIGQILKWSSQLACGAMLTVENDRSRIRILPFRPVV